MPDFPESGYDAKLTLALSAWILFAISETICENHFDFYLLDQYVRG